MPNTKYSDNTSLNKTNAQPKQEKMKDIPKKIHIIDENLALILSPKIIKKIEIQYIKWNNLMLAFRKEK
jgi:hypothetical protein